MSIAAFQNVCHAHNIATSACNTTADNFYPECSETTMMVIRLWKDNGAQFSINEANQDGSIVLNPQNRQIAFPNEEQFQKLDQTVQDCVSKLFDCLKVKTLPITKERVMNILGDTVVKFQAEAGSPFSQVI